MALPTQGLGLVGTVIRVGGIPVATHLQFINWTNQHEIEIVNNGFPVDFDLRIDATDSATFGRPVNDYAYAPQIDLGGRVADNVWQLAIQATNSIDAAGLTYEVLTQNSNSFINSLFLSLGLNINTYLGTAEPANDTLGFVGVTTDIRDKVTFNIAGTAGDDWFFSGAKNDTLYGGAGNDSYSGGAGADVLYGGAGTDTLYYYNSTAGVTLNLAYNYATGGEAQGDIISGFENVIGSNRGNDLIVADANSNSLFGFGGNDVLAGQGGTDYLFGGQGSDYFYGGSEADYACLYYGDIYNGDADYFLDFSAAGGDYVLLPTSVQASTYFTSYNGYAIGYIVNGAGYYVFGAANTPVADLQSHTYFF
jgi:Ca2+-binding RTX toxin-like protein